MLNYALALIGLCLAMYQIHRVERVAVAAKQSAEAAQDRMNLYSFLLLIPEFALAERELDLLTSSDGDKRRAEIRRVIHDWQARCAELQAILRAIPMSSAGLAEKVQTSATLAYTASGNVAKGKDVRESTERFRKAANDVVMVARTEAGNARASLPSSRALPTYKDDIKWLVKMVFRRGRTA